MIATTPARAPERPNRSRRRPRVPRKPHQARFEAFQLRLPSVPEGGVPWSPIAMAALMVCGILAGALWPQHALGHGEQDETFVMEEEIAPPTPEPPPPPADPAPPPPPEAKVEPPPPPQFGLEDDALGTGGDMAVATGNTIMKEADSVAAPAPPPMTAAPIFVDQAPRILAGDPPVYPDRALDRGLEGTVVALISIDTNGTVTAVTIEKSAGGDFDNAVLKAARQTRFQAPVRNGRKVPARFRRPFEFGLE
jgi:periplasmic protein TonB